MKFKLPVFIILLVFFASCTSDDPVEAEEQLDLTVTITPAFNVKGDIASSGASINDADETVILNKGVSYSLNPSPTIDDMVVENEDDVTTFEVDLENLDFNAAYYARAFVETAEEVFYSDEISFTTTNECTLNVFDGDIELTTQAEVDAFGANDYCSITGELLIDQGEAGSQDPIISLQSLNNLRYVGVVKIRNTDLKNIDGLNNLSIIEKSIQLYNNNSLLNINAFSGVSSSLNSIQMDNNENLSTLEGLSNIPSLILKDGEDPVLKLGGFQNLSNLDALNGLNFDGDNGTVDIHSSSITNLDGISNIAPSGKLAWLSVVGMFNLTNLDAFSSITSTGLLRLSFNLESFDLTGIQNISTVDQLLIFVSPGLSNLDAFSNLTEISGALQMLNNENLTDYCGILQAIPNDADYFYNVKGNNYDPTYLELLNGNCTP